MKKKMASGVIWSYPLNKKSKIKCEGYVGSYSIIDAATYQNEVYVFLEHNQYGDETELLLAVLPRACLRWYIVENNNGKQEKYFFIKERDILAESYDTISIAIDDHYNSTVELDEIEIWTDEEINKMEVM